MLLSLNGAQVVECSLTLPRVGLWHADLVVDQLANISGPAVLSFDDAGVKYKGGVVRQGLFGGYLRARIAAGSGQLWSTDVPAKTFQAAPPNALTLQTLIADVLANSGDSIDATADASVLSLPLQYWARSAQNAVAALQALLDGRAPSWRMTAAGGLWVGTDAYAVVDGAFPYQLLDDREDLGRLEIAQLSPDLVPGSSFLGHNIGRVVYRVDSDSFTTTAYVD